MGPPNQPRISHKPKRSKHADMAGRVAETARHRQAAEIGPGISPSSAPNADEYVNDLHKVSLGEPTLSPFGPRMLPRAAPTQ